MNKIETDGQDDEGVRALFNRMDRIRTDRQDKLIGLVT